MSTKSESRGLVVSKEQADQLDKLIEAFYTSAWADGHCQEFSLKEKRINGLFAEVFGVLGVSVEEQK